MFLLQWLRYIYISFVIYCYGAKSVPFIITKKMPLILVHRNFTKLRYNQRRTLHNESLIYITSCQHFVIMGGSVLLRWFEWWVDLNLNTFDWLLHSRNQQTCLYWLYCSTLHKHVEIENDPQSANHNALDSLLNVQWNAIITALTEGAIDLVWGCLAPP